MKMRVADLQPHPYNLSIYGEPDDSLKSNIRDFGLLNPIAVDQEGRILAGARRWKAAAALGETHIAARVIPVADDSEAQRFILLDNNYRNVKTDAVRTREAQGYENLLAAEKITTEQLAEQAKRHKRPATTRRDLQPRRLSAAAANISPDTRRHVEFVMEPINAEAEIERAARDDEISEGDAAVLRRELRTRRQALESDSISASRAAHETRTRLREARVSHGRASIEEVRARETDKMFDAALRHGEKFAGALRVIQHDARVRYLGDKHAGRLVSTLGEIADATRILTGKAPDDFAATARRSVEAGREVEA